MTDLTDFLLARIAEDEAVARSVQEAEPKSSSDVFTSLSAPTGTVEMSPARVLAECDAKRRIVEFLVNEVKDARRRPGWTIPAADLTNDVDRAYRTGVENQKAQQLPDALDRTDRLLRLLALSYADHPDYREEWRP